MGKRERERTKKRELSISWNRTVNRGDNGRKRSTREGRRRAEGGGGGPPW